MNTHLSFEDGWKVLEQGIVKCSKILEGFIGTRPTVAEYMNCYDCAYRMAVQKNHYCLEMYNGYKRTLEECVRAMVLPHLMHKRDDYLLRELVRLWSNYCVMVRCISGFFSYLDRSYIEHQKLPLLEDTAATSFFTPVFSCFSREITDALLTLIRHERDGSSSDMDLVIGIMRGICHSELKTPMKNVILQDTFAHYSRKSSEWIMQYSLSDYLVKVDESMVKETKSLVQLLSIPERDSSELCLQVVKAPLMEIYNFHSREKHDSGKVLPQIYKTVEEELLARCSRLTISNGSDNSSFSHMK